MFNQGLHACKGCFTNKSYLINNTDHNSLPSVHFCSHFTDKESEAQRVPIAGPRPHSGGAWLVCPWVS